MPAGLLGRKMGMTRVFDAAGRVTPVTVIRMGPCAVVQRKTVENDGYSAIQVGFEEAKRSRTNSPMTGHFESRNVRPMRILREFHVGPDEAYEPGDALTLAMFETGQKVQVIGTSKGRGFAGGIKRHNFHGGPASHGSKVHRAPMSAGATDAARVFKGKRGPGHMGAAQVTVKGLRVVEMDADNNLLVISGPVPGATGSVVVVQPQ
jgi:large subunit ribosomal protein L3